MQPPSTRPSVAENGSPGEADAAQACDYELGDEDVAAPQTSASKVPSSTIIIEEEEKTSKKSTLGSMTQPTPKAAAPTIDSFELWFGIRGV